MARIPRLSTLTTARRVLLGAAVGAAAACALTLLRGTDLVESLELRLVDVRTRHFADRRDPDPRIVIVQIHDSDLADVNRQLGVRWPWPLEYNAHLVNVLREGGARALLVDILHLDRGAGPDDVPGGDKLPDAARQLREIEAEGATEYGTALSTFGRAVVAFELTDAPTYEVAARVAAAATRLGGDPPGAGHAGPRRSGAEVPVRRVAEGAALLGFSNVPTDADGVTRRCHTFGRWGGRTVLSLPMATLRLLGGAEISDPALATMADGSFLVNVPGRPHARLAASQLIDWALRKDSEGALPPEAKQALDGKIVVLGINVAGIKDVVAGPMGGTMDGPVFQATALDNLLHGDGRVRAPRSSDRLWLYFLTLVAGVLGSFARGRLLPHLVPLLGGAVFAWWAFHQFGGGVSYDLVTPLAGLVLTWGGTSALRALTEGRRNHWLEGTFGRYMAPSIIEALKGDPTLLALGGRTRTISVLFSDVADFTRMSAQLEAPQLVRLLNRYLTAHCAAVMEQGGVVDKFEGDAVMAFFGDPVEQPDHTLRACHAALRVQRDLPRLRPLLDELGLPAFTVRIGINSGEAVVGNMGSEQRFDYTCMGDTVNLASRLEGAGKAFGASILIGGTTGEAVRATMLVKRLGALVVVGREAPVPAYELLAERDGAAKDLVAHVEAFEAALTAAREGDVDAARASLAEADRLRPDDGPVAWFRGVLDALDGAAWDGVTVLHAK